MTRHKNHMNSAKDLDRQFERGVSDVSRMPQAPMTDAQIASAAAASKTGAGIWLLSHAKELLIGVASFAVGVGGTLLVTHAFSNRNTLSQPAQSIHTVVSADTTLLANDTVSAIDETSALYDTPVETFHGTSLKPAQPAATPVIVTKTVTLRDTVHIHETITIKDTVYVP